jgi:hypothetical protein
MRWPFRVALAVLVGMLAAAWVYDRGARAASARPSDFSQLWAGARALLAGADPYQAVGPGRFLEWHTALVYPLPAVLLAVPVAGLSMHGADAAFAGVGAALLTLALASRGGFALCGLLSWCFVSALLTVQWSPYLGAALVFPALGALVIAKPHVGLAVAAAKVTRPMVLGGVALVALAFVLQPDWPLRWWAALHAPTQQVPGGTPVHRMYGSLVGRPLGPLALLALFRWRRPEARVLLVLACVPQTMYAYELLPLLVVVPHRWWQSAALAASSWVVLAGDIFFKPAYRDWLDIFAVNGALSLWCVLLPALVIVLARPNVGVVPPSVEALLARWRVPVVLRGRAGGLPSQTPRQ